MGRNKRERDIKAEEEYLKCLEQNAIKLGATARNHVPYVPKPKEVTLIEKLRLAKASPEIKELLNEAADEIENLKDLLTWADYEG